MVARKNKNFDRSKGLLVMVIGVLILVIVAMIATYPRSKAVASTDDGVHVNLGSMAYRITNNRAVKRTDASVTELASFLRAMGQKDISSNCPSTYYSVIAAAKDEKQVLLSYGCGYPTIGMFAVKQNGAWKTLSPTNQFDTFGIPSCDYVNGNKIDKTIAPVCQSGFGKTGIAPTYSVRS